MTTFDSSRREAIKKAGIAGVGTIAAGLMFGGIAKAFASGKTPPQPEGPFYPVKDQLDKDADMTRVAGRADAALGQRVRLRGQVIDITTGAAVAGAMVEFWQACESGKYHHPNDPNEAPLDPNFQYWAQVATDDDGRFGLLTIKPGAYPADDTWIRPPHIHIKVHKAGYPSLTTQIYFAGEALNASDQILGRLTPYERSLVIVDFRENTSTHALEGEWTIYISRFMPENHVNGVLDLGATTPEIMN